MLYLGVLRSMLLTDAISAEGVVVETGVLHQRYPFSPSRGHIGAVILIQIFAKEG